MIEINNKYKKFDMILNSKKKYKKFDMTEKFWIRRKNYKKFVIVEFKKKYKKYCYGRKVLN